MISSVSDNGDYVPQRTSGGGGPGIGFERGPRRPGPCLVGRNALMGILTGYWIVEQMAERTEAGRDGRRR